MPEYFKFRTDTFMTQIPYQGTGPAMGDLVAGHVQIMFDTLLTSTPFVKSGKLRMLAVTTAQRLPHYPDVPTIAEALEMKDFEASSWFAMWVPAGTPADIVKRLSAEPRAEAARCRQATHGSRRGTRRQLAAGSPPPTRVPNKTNGAR